MRSTPLRQFIRQILNEAAGPGKIGELITKMTDMNARLKAGGIPFKIMIGIRQSGAGTTVNFTWGQIDKKGKVVNMFPSRGESEPLLMWWVKRNIGEQGEKYTAAMDLLASIQYPYGYIETAKPAKGETGKCSSARVVVVTAETRSGWGPLLYDVAIEASGRSGLMPDRFSVTSDAEHVWSIYDKVRGDVEKTPLDIDIERTGLRGADIKRAEKTRLTPEDDSDDCAQVSSWNTNKSKWSNSPLAKVYNKPKETISTLESLGLLIKY